MVGTVLGAASSRFSRVRVLTLLFLVPHAYSTRGAERPLGHVNQGTQGRIDGLLVREILRDIRREEYEIRSRSVARDIFTADAAFQSRQVVLAA
jgi:hypothetical protein